MKPKTLCYSGAISQLDDSTKDVIAAHDVLVTDGNPDEIADLRLRNPNLKWYFKVQPQHVKPWESRWSADRTWSPTREWEDLCNANEYYLRDTDGEILNDGVHRIVNWTPYSHAPTVWVEVIDSRMARFDGLVIEMMPDCLGTSVPNLTNADPDGDGRREGVTKACSLGGYNEPLSVLMRVANYMVRDSIIAWSRRFPVVMNDHVFFGGPFWALSYRNAIKIKRENWLHKVLTSQNPVAEYWNQLRWPKPFVFCHYEFNEVMGSDCRARLCLATALLKDAYCMISEPGERVPWRLEEMDNELGNHVNTMKSRDRVQMVYTKGRVTIDLEAMDAEWD